MGKRRREDPTMETQLERWNPELSAKYNNLVQQYMETCRPSNPPDHNLLDRRHSAGSNGSVSIDESLINKYSPREIMSSLQQKCRSPGSSQCMSMSNSMLRTNDDTVAQILMDRQSAFQSGRLIGRRLFQDTDDEDINNEELDGEEICSDCFDLMINEQVKSVLFSASDDQIINDEEFCCPTSSRTSLVISDDGKLVNGEMVVETERSNSGKGENGRVRTVMHASMGIVLILSVIWMSCNGWYYMGSEDDAQVFLVPT